MTSYARNTWSFVKHKPGDKPQKPQSVDEATRQRQARAGRAGAMTTRKNNITLPHVTFLDGEKPDGK